MLLIEQDMSLSQREQFSRQIEVLLNHFLEYREFLFVQVRESTHQMSEQFTSYLHAKQMELLHWLGRKVTAVYGEEMSKYAIDLALVFEGILFSNMRFFMFTQVPFSPHQLGQFVLTKLDHLVAGLKRDGGEALISEEEWNNICMIPHMEPLRKKHPLLILKELKSVLLQLHISSQDEEDVLQSIQILERELLDSTPRRAILQGMCHNLLQVKELEALTHDLIEATKPLLEIHESI